MLSLALDPGRSGFRPAVIRVRITKSAIARNDQRDALFQRPHAAIVPDVVPDVFYRALGTLVGSARADVEQNGRCDRHYDEHELHGSSPIGQLALNVRSEAVPPISSEINARAFHCPKPPVLPTKRIAHFSRSGDRCGAGFQSGPCRLRVKLDRVGPSENLIFVRYAPNSDRPRVSYRIVGSAISGPQLTQEPKLLARKHPSRRYRRPSGATSPAANPPQL